MSLRINNSDPMVETTIHGSSVLVQHVAKCAEAGGLFDALEQYRTPLELQVRMGVHPSKTKTLALLLKCLADKGMLEERHTAGGPVYRRKNANIAAAPVTDNSLGKSKFDRMMQPFGFSNFKYGWATNTGTLLGHNLSFLRTGPEDKVPFGRALLSEQGLDWRHVLTDPVYELGRLMAVRSLVTCGRRFLDLACGPGFGIQRLAEYSTNGCEVVAVDRSSEMLEEAGKIIFPGAKVEFILRDLNTGLPPLVPDSFDGILFCGAFHFIEDKRSRLNEMYRALRPGGCLVLGHNFTQSGQDDESTWEFYFTLLKEELYPISLTELQALVSEIGFLGGDDQYHRGSFSYLTLRKPEHPIPHEGVMS